MPNPADPLERIKRISAAYEDLKAKFVSFHAGVARLADDQQSPIKPHTKVLVLRDNSFRVEFCDRLYEFQLKVGVDDNGPLGTVTCSEVDGEASDSFTFRANGLANVEQPATYSAPIAVDQNVGAIFLAARCLNNCLTVRGAGG